MLEELHHLWATTFCVSKARVTMRFLLLMADHKQLNYLSGVQGYSTSQRCSFCTVPAHLFVLNGFAGAIRTFERTAANAVACAEEILEQPANVAAIRRKYDNGADISFVMLHDRAVPYFKVLNVPPSMHNNRGILQSTYEWLWDHVAYPVGMSSTLTKARKVLLSRLAAPPLTCTRK